MKDKTKLDDTAVLWVFYCWILFYLFKMCFLKED